MKIRVGGMALSRNVFRLPVRAAMLCACSTAALAGDTTQIQYDALGRVIVVSTTGGPVNGQSVTTTYDAAGNRTNQTVSGAAPSPTPAPAPSPTPTPAPSNQPPVANGDSVSMPCNSTRLVSVLANDTDPENNVPLVLVSATGISAVDAMASANNQVYLESYQTPGTFTLYYQVGDSLGAQSTGSLTVNVTGTLATCSGGGFQ